MELLGNKNKGFTLIEVIVSLTIVALISGAMMANYRAGEETNKLILAANSLSGDFRAAQNNTLGAVRYGTTTPDGGWGIHIDLDESDTSYKLFANENYDNGNNLTYDEGEALEEYGGKTVELEEGITMASTTAGSELDVTFVPPDPDTMIYDGDSLQGEVEIFLENNQGLVKKVKVSSFGLVEVLN